MINGPSFADLPPRAAGTRDEAPEFRRSSAPVLMFAIWTPELSDLPLVRFEKAEWRRATARRRLVTRRLVARHCILPHERKPHGEHPNEQWRGLAAQKHKALGKGGEAYVASLQTFGGARR